jgi:hypothetical protein
VLYSAQKKRLSFPQSDMATRTPLPLLSQFHSRCKVCEAGDLIPKRIFRLSGPVVAMGFILVILAVLGIVAVGLTFFTIAVRFAPLLHVMTGAFAIALGLVSIVCGLLGWLLVRKKRVLQCSACGSIVRLP